MSPAAVGRRRLPDLAVADAGRLLPLPPGGRQPLGLDQISGDHSKAELRCILCLVNLETLNAPNKGNLPVFMWVEVIMIHINGTKTETEQWDDLASIPSLF